MSSGYHHHSSVRETHVKTAMSSLRSWEGEKGKTFVSPWPSSHEPIELPRQAMLQAHGVALNKLLYLSKPCFFMCKMRIVIPTSQGFKRIK